MVIKPIEKLILIFAMKTCTKFGSSRRFQFTIFLMVLAFQNEKTTLYETRCTFKTVYLNRKLTNHCSRYDFYV